MADPGNDMLLGRLAVHFKMLTKEQLGEVTAQQGRLQEPVPMGQTLLAMELISQEQLAGLFKAREQYLENQRKKASQDASPTVQAVPVASTQEDRVSQPNADPAGVPTNGAIVSDDAVVNDDAVTNGHAVTNDDAVTNDAVTNDDAVADEDVVTNGHAAANNDAVADEDAVTNGHAAANNDAVANNGAVANDSAVSKLSVTEMASESLLDDILRKAVALGASDVHVHANTPILMRVHGHLKTFGEVLEPTRSDAVVRSLLVDSQREVLESEGQLDFAYEIAGVARFRCNAYRQHNGTDVTLRVIPPDPPSLDQLALPATLRALADFHNGLVLVTGPSGCGKSSTLAALVNIVNHERRDHILTIEDPIEYVHESAQCVVNQREVHRHTESFGRALRAALREDPDIIAIGELRDLETISLAITAAETGHLVFGTLHTHDTISTIDRLIGVFQPEEQAQVRTMLSESLRAVVSQRLVPRADGKGRVPALEILMNNGAVGNLIRADKTFQLGSVLQTGAAQGMLLLDDSLAQLVKEGTVACDVAVRFAAEPSKFPA